MIKSKALQIMLAIVLTVTAAFASDAARPATAAGPGQYSAPSWLPLRGSWVIGCTWNNGCSGGYHGYFALDLARNPSGSVGGDNVYAAGAGLATIYSTGNTCGGSGTASNVVQVDHGSNVKSYYYHLGGFAISGPTWVDENTVIGYVGHTGYVDPCTFNHLHFEVRNNGSRVNPGQLKACHGAQLLTYPSAAAGNPAGWNLVPLWSAASNDGTTCTNPGGSQNGGSVIRGVASGRCIDIPGASTANGVRPSLWDCNSGYAQQQWTFDAGRLRVYGNYGKCLDADGNSGGTNGTAIQIWDCNGAPWQQWTFAAGGAIRSVASGRCVDAISAGTANGTQFQLYDCHGGTNQAWIGVPTSNGGGTITGVHSGRCVDIPGASMNLGVRPSLWDCSSGYAQQQWRIIGSQLQVYSDKCLDIAGAGTANGTPVQIWYCSGAIQQQWSWESDGTIRSTQSGRCLDATGAGTANGTQLQIWDCNGAPWQRWNHVGPA